MLAVLHPKLLACFLAVAVYVAAVCYLANRIDLWNTTLVKETVIWFLVSGLVLITRFQNITRGEPFLRRAAVITILATVAIEYLLNLFVLPLWAELLLQPFVAVIAITLVVAEREPKYEPARRLLNALFSGIGLSLAAYAIWNLVAHWNSLDKLEAARELALPLWLGLAVTPVVYLVAVLTAYETLFVRLTFLIKDDVRRRRTKLALLSTFFVQVKQIASFGPPWTARVAAQESLGGARAEMRKYHKARGSCSEGDGPVAEPRPTDSFPLNL